MTIHKKADRILVDHKQFTMIRQVLISRAIYFIAGTSSIFVPARDEKYLISHNHRGLPLIREWPDLDGEMLWMSPGEAARTEMRREWPDLKRVGWPRGSTHLFDWRWPMYFPGPFKGDAVYTDLVGAYHQIYSKLWLDTAFPRGTGRLPLRPVADRIGVWKAARNSLVGIVRSRETIGFKGSTLVKLRPQNQFLSPHLWATVLGVLNELAIEAIKTGAVYVATDGYFHPVGSRIKDFQEMLGDYGLIYRTNVDTLHLRAWGNYQFGQRSTINYNKIAQQGAQPLKSIQQPVEVDGLYLTNWWKGLS